jgi:L-asparaginase II
MADYVSLVEVTRGQCTESVHYGAVAVVDTTGRVLAHTGNPHAVIFTRSSLKPFQAMPFVARGGLEKFGFTEPELAVMCASHNGEDLHVEAVRSMLSKIECTEADLQCGSHVPNHITEAGQRVVGKADFSPVYNNCSGKHAGMLAFCRLLGVPHHTYLDPEHPIQVEIRQCTSYFTGVPLAKLCLGTDGCSAPNYALPLSGLARAFARLSVREPDPTYGEAPGRIFAAMTAHPRMVSGLGRGDLAIMETGGGDWVSKVGGEAVKGVGIRSLGLGLAVKVAGGGTRALVPLVAEVLRQLDILPDAEGTPLATWARPAIRNHRDIVTGHIVARFQLEQTAAIADWKGALRATGTV